MQAPNIVILDGYAINPGDESWDALAELGTLRVYERTPPEQLAQRAQGARVLLTNKTPLDAEALARLPELAGISVLATGYNVVDVEAARARGVVVCNVPDYSSASVAEHTFALLLELCRAVGLHAASVRAGEWSRNIDFCYWKTTQLELAGRALGVVGYGAIGSAVARIARAFGMRVLATASRARAPEPGVEVRSLSDLFAEADVVSLHCPLTRETRHLVNAERLATMKRTAFLINTARGGLIDSAALARALACEVIAGAALDVLEREPPAADEPLLTAPRCVITPHLAWTTQSARRRLIETSVRNVRGILSGAPVNVVS